MYTSKIYFLLVFVSFLTSLRTSAQNISLRASEGISFVLFNSRGNTPSISEFQLEGTSRLTPAIVGTYLGIKGLGFHLGVGSVPVKYKIINRDDFILTDNTAYRHVKGEDYISFYGGLTYVFLKHNNWQFSSHLSGMYSYFARRSGDINYYIVKPDNVDTISFASKRVRISENSRWGPHWGLRTGVEVSRRLTSHWSLSAETNFTYFFGTFKTITINYRDQINMPESSGTNVYTINPSLLTFLIGVKGDINLRAAKKEL